MAATAALNAEPANPTEREENELPPKGYKDAIEEASPADATNGVNGINGSQMSEDVNGESREGSNGTDGKPHVTSVLKIVNTDGGAENESVQERPPLNREESKHEYSATVCILSIYTRANLTVIGP